MRLKKKNHNWEAFDYKIYPSSLKSLTMCPKRFIEEDVHKPPGFELPAVYKMEVGKAIHALFQDAAIDSELVDLAKTIAEEVPEEYASAVDLYIRKMYRLDAVKTGGLLWAAPTITDPAILKKLTESWPEVPVWDAASGISGRADLVLDVDDHPCILDLKTTSVIPSKWEEYTQKPSSEEQYKLQISLYAYFMNKYNYYSKPVKKIGLAYVNLLMAPGEEDSEFEVYYDYTEKMDADIASLVEHLTIQRNAYIKEKATVECTYPKCKEHTKNV